MIPSTQSLSIIRFSASKSLQLDDVLSVEEPLEISIRYGLNLEVKNLSVTMRTPGHDEELALGFLLSEGIITNYEQVVGTVQEDANRISVVLHEDTPFDPTKFERHIYTTSSCGICAKSSIEAVRVESTLTEIYQDWVVTAPTLYRLPWLLRERQADFSSTGGLHAAALFTQKGDFLYLREDVGRHNALDKIIGHALKTDSYPLRTQILLLSGRASFELIQKAALSGISFVAAVGAPSTLAVQLAQEMNIALVGFLKKDRFNVYSGVERVE
ncbi:formate dehydrogenase accessory sulfurtransferase FdhD [Persicitalea sp.]|uniref:formate dehydrogenase accessory sulfurtransferase FdhD n=1 Tax=Persicitalea sp. TaxID=3100273 RepID=UPI00359417C8